MGGDSMSDVTEQEMKDLICDMAEATIHLAEVSVPSPESATARELITASVSRYSASAEVARLELALLDMAKRL
jgi:hypothetical protein